MKFLILSVAAGIIVELLFQLLKIVDEIEKSPPIPKYVTYDRYIRIDEFVAAGNRRWSKYLFFRLFPPALVFSLMVGIERKYFTNPHILLSLMIATTVSIIPRDLIFLRKGTTSSFAERSVHLVNITSVYIVSIAIVALNSHLDFRYIAPSLAGLVDNLWSTLFVAVLFAFYNLMSKRPSFGSDYEQRNKEANFVITSYRKLEGKYGVEIDKLTASQNASKALVYSILIYEDMNRPALVRFIERRIVQLTHKELTVGIAQVKSKTPLSDIESIRKAVAVLADSQPEQAQIYSNELQDYTSLLPFLKKYNYDPNYSKSVIDILSHLRQYAPSLFERNFSKPA